ncbi:MAG: hypothetical protein LBQ14_00085 [Treponema sp.]|jgi:hypothetical protein|nr:hypothetical protein [Treponema sp.]
MVNWPAGKKSMEEVSHDLNESHIYQRDGTYGNKRRGGGYPVGANGAWHAGIHIYADAPIYPLIDGQLAACRISGRYAEIHRQKKINAEELLILTGEEKELYEKDTSLPSNRPHEIFKLKDENSTEGVPDSFVLIKHDVPVDPDNQDAKKICFFTLYTWLLPYQEIGKIFDYFGEEYKPIAVPSPGEVSGRFKLPFYINCRFKFSGTGDKDNEFRCAEIEGVKVYAGSELFTDENILMKNGEDDISCMFMNDERSTTDIIQSPKIIKRKYVTFDNAGGIQWTVPEAAGIYRVRDGAVYRLGTIGAGKEFNLLDNGQAPARDGWNRDGKYVKIRISETAISSSIEGWLYMPGIDFGTLANKDAVDRAIQGLGDRNIFSKYTCEKAGPGHTVLKPGGTTYTHCPYVFASADDDNGLAYKFVAFEDFIKKGGGEYLNRLHNLSGLDANNPAKILPRRGAVIGPAEKPEDKLKYVVVVKGGREDTFLFDPVNGEFSPYVFYYNNEPVSSYFVGEDFFARLEKKDKTGIKAFKAGKMTELNPGGEGGTQDYIEIPGSGNPGSAGDFLKGIGFIPCRLFLLDRSNSGEKISYDMFIEAAKIKPRRYSLRGIVSEPPGNGSETGFMVYDEVQAKDSVKDCNTRKVLTDSMEFELAEPEGLLINPEPGFYKVKDAGGTSDADERDDAHVVRFVHIKKIEDVKARMTFNEKYRSFAAGGERAVRIGAGTVLGLPAPVPHSRQDFFYDLALFSKENILEGHTGWGKDFIQLAEEDTNTRGDIICDIDIKSLMESRIGEAIEDAELVKYKRRIACKHPLEFDKTKYDNAKARLHFSGFDQDHQRVLLETVEATDVWEFIKNIEGIKPGENNLWFLHPAYFLDQLDKVNPRLLAVGNLIKAQDLVMSAGQSQPRTEGSYNYKAGRPWATWCNQATFDVLEAPGFHTAGLYKEGRRDKTNANHAARRLAEMAKPGGSLKELEPKEAQEKANEGWTVAAAWENKAAGESGHMATVRPGYNDFQTSEGPRLANVGGTVGVKPSREGFYLINIKQICYYYDPNQTFTFDTSKIKCIQ